MRTIFYWLSGKVRRERIALIYDYCASIVESGKKDDVAARIFRDCAREARA